MRLHMMMRIKSDYGWSVRPHHQGLHWSTLMMHLWPCFHHLFASLLMADKTHKSWYTRVSGFSLAALFNRKREPGPPRTIYVNENVPEHYFDRKGKPKRGFIFASNQVITSKYTIITFLPRNLLEQFRRIANLYVCTMLFFPLFHALYVQSY